MYDTAIIGTGPAGVSAALTLKALNVNFIWFGSKNLSMKITSAERIRNYPGLVNVSGKEMQEAFLKQISDMNIEITDKTVTGVYNMSTHYGILCNQDMYEAKTVILATGVESVKPIKGEIENLGKGVSYCATCDGFLYKNKEIAVFSTSKEYEHEIKYLSEIASKVYVFAAYKNPELDFENVIKLNGIPKEITSQDKMVSISYKDECLNVDGIFVLKSAISPSVLVPGLYAEDGHIVIDRMGKTNMNGCFAAGDCTGRPYQYTKAVGEGNVAAHSVNKYLNSVKE